MSKPVKIVLISSICLVVTLAIVLGCVFGIKCTVTFYSGISSNLSSYYDTDTSNWLLTMPPQAKVTRGSTFSPFIPSAEGYQFLGWYKDSALTMPWSSTDRVTSDITLYAKWIKD
jgi:uncharacterized repeat protein (TIGR02543 family)